MKTEGSFTQKLLAKMKSVDNIRMYLKLCDRFTKGIPDIMVVGVVPQTPLWLEVKVLRDNAQLIDPKDWLDNLPQAVLTARLGGYFYLYHETLKLTAIVLAKAALAYKLSNGTFITDSSEFQTFEQIYQPAIDLVKEHFHRGNSTYVDLRSLQRS